MTKDEKIFYKCLGFQTHHKYNKPLFFYHVPKCAGTTFVVLISHLFKITHRLSGPLFKYNDKGGSTAFEKFLKDENIINASNVDFLYGHVPFEVHNKLKKNYLFITTVREPIQRCISHYIWGINRGYFSIRDSIEDLFAQNKIPKNAIVNQFSGTGISNPNSDESIKFSLNNLSNKIDLIFDSEDVFKLLNLIISLYDLPNLFFQNQQVDNNKIKISKKTIDIIKKNNEKDVILYSKLLKNKLIRNHSFKKSKERNNKAYLYSSLNLLIDNQKTLLLNEEKIKAIERKLIKSNYQVQLV